MKQPAASRARLLPMLRTTDVHYAGQYLGVVVAETLEQAAARGVAA